MKKRANKKEMEMKKSDRCYKIVFVVININSLSKQTALESNNLSI